MRRRRNRQSATVAVCLIFLKLLIFIPSKLIKWFAHRRQEQKYLVDFSDYPDEYEDESNEDEINDEIRQYSDLPEIPEMQQIFDLGDNTILGVQYVSMCPDETAHIRIIGDTSFSQLYKRKVYREKNYKRERYFNLNNIKYYLDDRYTQPIEPLQAKKGK